MLFSSICHSGPFDTVLVQIGCLLKEIFEKEIRDKWKSGPNGVLILNHATAVGDMGPLRQVLGALMPWEGFGRIP